MPKFNQPLLSPIVEHRDKIISRARKAVATREEAIANAAKRMSLKSTTDRAKYAIRLDIKRWQDEITLINYIIRP